MFQRFFPNKFVETIFDIDYQALYAMGKRGILFDIDNTLVPYDVPHPNEQIIKLFEEIKSMGFKISLVSNNNKDRVIKFNEKLKVFAVHKAKKPFTKNLKKAMKLMATSNENTVIIGDQIFTDVLGGNRLGLMTILVAPISEKEEWVSKIKRNTEKKILARYMKGRNENDN